MSGTNFTESSPFLLLFLLGYCLAVIEGELRCYCNESGCVATGYMCKSSAGQCFTAVELRGEVTHHTHGCLDSLTEEHRALCRLGVDVITLGRTDWAAGHLPLLLCCTEHMCNYREDVSVNAPPPKYNRTSISESAPASEDVAIAPRNHHGFRDDERDLWFKAAVIAVPIAGGFILVLLVLLAIRMLRTDTHHHRRLIQIRHERSLTKAHMYISEHFSGIGAKQHCSLFNKNEKRTCVPLYKCEAATGSIKKGSSGGSTKPTSTWRSSYFSDSSNSFCNFPLHHEKIHTSDSISNKDVNSSSHSGPQTPFTADFTNASVVTGLTDGENHHKNDGGISKLCSFSTDSTMTNLNLTQNNNSRREVCLRTGPVSSRLVSSRADSKPCILYSSTARCDKAYSEGPTAIV